MQAAMVRKSVADTEKLLEQASPGVRVWERNRGELCLVWGAQFVLRCGARTGAGRRRDRQAPLLNALQVKPAAQWAQQNLAAYQAREGGLRGQVSCAERLALRWHSRVRCTARHACASYPGALLAAAVGATSHCCGDPSLQVDGKRGELEAFRRDMLRAGLEASAAPASGLEAEVQKISLI